MLEKFLKREVVINFRIINFFSNRTMYREFARKSDEPSAAVYMFSLYDEKKDASQSELIY